MTLSTSDVAVCCSSASLSSRVRCCSASNSRTFSIAITAWSAKVCNQLDLLLGEWIHLQYGGSKVTPIGLIFSEHRDGQNRPVTQTSAISAPSGNSWWTLKVGDVNRRTIDEARP